MNLGIAVNREGLLVKLAPKRMLAGYAVRLGLLLVVTAVIAGLGALTVAIDLAVRPQPQLISSPRPTGALGSEGSGLVALPRGGTVRLGDFVIADPNRISQNYVVALLPQAMTSASPAPLPSNLPEGRIMKLKISDENGRQLTRLPGEITINYRYDSSVLLNAGVAPANATLAYFADGNLAEAPGLPRVPVDSWVYFPEDVTQRDLAAHQITVETTYLPDTMAVVEKPSASFKTLDKTVLFRDLKGSILVEKQKGAVLAAVGPKVANRILVEDPSTGRAGFVDAEKVAPV